MKKSAQTSKPTTSYSKPTQSNSYLFPLFAAFAIVVALAMGAVALKKMKLAAMRSADQSQAAVGYGPLGYGRGMGSGQWSEESYRSGSNRDKMMGTQAQQGINKQNCLMDGCLLVEDAEYPVAQLDEKTVEYLNLALADERKALGTYQATMEKFGNVRPFINIARAEEHHISMLLALFDKYGVTIPEDTTKVGALPATLQEVCTVGVTAEIDNDALYQQMIPQVQQEDIKTVFTSLGRASKEMHLPAFERCAN